MYNKVFSQSILTVELLLTYYSELSIPISIETRVEQVLYLSHVFHGLILSRVFTSLSIPTKQVVKEMSKTDQQTSVHYSEINVVSCVSSVQIYKSKYKTVCVLPIWKVKLKLSRELIRQRETSIIFLSDGRSKFTSK